MYYVYEVRYPNGTPFYVGKGSRDRVDESYLKSHNPEVAKLAENIRAKGQVPQFAIVFNSPIESEAFTKESELISFYGRADLGLGPLLNKNSETVTSAEPLKNLNLKINEADHYRIKAFCAKHKISIKDLILTCVFKHIEGVDGKVT
ncbi:TPA: plasmid partition protein ParG [Vibrio vulnificus]